MSAPFLTLGGTLSNSFDIPGTASGAVTDELADKLRIPRAAPERSSIAPPTVRRSPTSRSRRSPTSLQSAEDLDGVASVIDPFDAQQQQADRAKELADGQKQITDGRAQLDAAQTQIDEGRAQIEAGLTQLTGRAHPGGAGRSRPGATRRPRRPVGGN